MDRLTEKNSIGILCGDMRIVYLAKRYVCEGYKVYVFGLCDTEGLNGATVCYSENEVISASDVILLPLPLTRDGIYISSSKEKVALNHLHFGNKKKLILGGMIPENISNRFKDMGHTVYDYYKSESLMLKNAYATAEGAISIAMSNTKDTIAGSGYAVIGYGRIGKQLARILKLLGADVTVYARRDTAASDGYGYFRLCCDGTHNGYASDLAASLDMCSVIFNTVPSRVIGADTLEAMKERPIYIELASLPGGIDAQKARELGFNNIYAPSLPSRYAPRSAGEYIFDETQARIDSYFEGEGDVL